MSMYWIPQKRGIAMIRVHKAIWGIFLLGALLVFIPSNELIRAEEPEPVPPSVTQESTLPYTEAAILGVIEGLTEYLPVSSTGHLILADYFMDQSDQKTDTVSVDDGKVARNAYLIIIQAGGILAVLLIYWKKIISILMGLIGRNPQGLALGLKILIAFVPAALLGPLLNDLIEATLFNPVPVCIALVLGAVVMIVVERYRPSLGADDFPSVTIETLSFRSALFIGAMQCVAMWPGMSRSMITIVGGYLVGLRAKAAAEFSFLLGLVTLSAASCYSLLKSGDVLIEQIQIGPALIGILVATVVAFLAVKWFIGYLTRHGMFVFAIYRLILAIAILWLCRA